MKDTISRQAAIDAAKSIIAKHEARMVKYSEHDPHTSGKDTHLKHSNRADGAEEVLYELYNLPSAEPKIGKWIADRYCSECEWDKKDVDYASGWKENYCPNCGVKMRGKEDERALSYTETEITRCGKCARKDKIVDFCHFLGITICKCDYCSFAERRTDETD